MSSSSGLSINPLSYYSSYYPQKNVTNALTAYRDLGKALQSGNISNAQIAFAVLQQAGQGPNQGGMNRAVAADMTNLGNALSSNNLASAQASYAQLRQDVEATRPTQPSQASASGGVFQTLISQLLPSSLTSSSASTATTASSTSALPPASPIPGTLNVQA
jgi:hypothetical protein